MPQIKVTIEEVIDVPEGTEIVLAPTGVTAGIRLPTGQFLKPWIVMEHFAGQDDKEDPLGDLGHSELTEFGVIPLIDLERHMEVVDGEISTDSSRVNAS